MFNRIAKYLDNINRTRNGLDLEPGSKIHESAQVTGTTCSGKITIGEQSKILFSPYLTPRSSVHWEIHFRQNGPNTEIMARINPIEIGSFCSIARECVDPGK